MLDDEKLRAIMPGTPAARRTEFLPFLRGAMTEFAIDAPPREAAFIAQLAHESGQFRFMEEIWGPTDAQRRYEPPSTLATTLGNTAAGDGKRFKGRGPIQITGRANYKRFGDLLGLDLVGDPPQAAQPAVAFRIAGLFWSKKGLNELADRATPDAFKEITRRINGGFNGLADRQKFYETACRALGVTVGAATRSLPGEASRSIEQADAEPAFERGFEAIVAAGPARPRRTAAARRTARVARRKRVKTAVPKKAAPKKAAPKKAASRKAAARRTAGKKKTVRTAGARKAAARRTPARRTAKRSVSRRKKR
jgi:putative chitinase